MFNLWSIFIHLSRADCLLSATVDFRHEPGYLQHSPTEITPTGNMTSRNMAVNRKLIRNGGYLTTVRMAAAAAAILMASLVIRSVKSGSSALLLLLFLLLLSTVSRADRSSIITCKSPSTRRLRSAHRLLETIVANRGGALL